MIEVDVFVPLYNAENCLDGLLKSIYKQKGIKINKVLFAITESNDNTLSLIKEFNNVSYFVLTGKEFSHSLTREQGIQSCTSKFVIMMTQDVIIEDSYAFYNLVNGLNESPDIVFSFGRQISKYKNIERYIREKNYPKTSYVVSKNDIERMQLRAFFSSDAFAVYNRDVFLELNGYDHKKLPLSEDMYYSRKCLMNGYKVKYCAEAVVFHSHKFKLKELYSRYYLTGKFFKENPEFQNYKSTETGLKLAFYVFKEIIKHFDVCSFFRFFPDMAVRYIGKKKGEKE